MPGHIMDKEIPKTIKYVRTNFGKEIPKTSNILKMEAKKKQKQCLIMKVLSTAIPVVEQERYLAEISEHKTNLKDFWLNGKKLI